MHFLKIFAFVTGGVVGFLVLGAFLLWLAVGPGIGYPEVLVQNWIDNAYSPPKKIADYPCGDGYEWVVENQDFIVPGAGLAAIGPAVNLRHADILYLLKDGKTEVLFYLYRYKSWESPLKFLSPNNSIGNTNTESPCLGAAAKTMSPYEPFWSNWAWKGTNQ
jgi:hypothetical protein